MLTFYDGYILMLLLMVYFMIRLKVFVLFLESLGVILGGEMVGLDVVVFNG
jgi:hypothetical protein